MKVLAAMSGGVDSAVAAARAVDAGHDVVGVHLALSRMPGTLRTGSRGCCTIEDASDAWRACERLGIPFYTWDFSERFAEDVVDDFVAEYEAGRTPNPCLRCNERIKFAALLDKALALGFDGVATGHYAQIVETPQGRELHRAVDPAKDQSYVLGVLTADQLAERGLDGGKTLTRVCLGDPGTAATLEATAQAIDQLAARRLMAMIEPFWSVRESGRVRNLLDPDSTIKSIHVASGLGTTSAYTWLKLPVVDDLERVMEATTLPTLLLGGDPTGEPEDTYASWRKALGLGPVRGLVVGRALLYPPDGDVATAVDIAAEMVHGGAR